MKKLKAIKRITAIAGIDLTPPDSDIIIEAIYENKEAKLAISRN